MILQLRRAFTQRPEAPHELVTRNWSQREVVLSLAPPHEILVTNLELTPHIQIVTEPRTRILPQRRSRWTPYSSIRDALVRLGRRSAP